MARTFPTKAIHALIVVPWKLENVTAYSMRYSNIEEECPDQPRSRYWILGRVQTSDTD
jgi:hypothetical protein